MKTFKIFGGFWGQNYLFWQISETRFSKQFSLKFFCLFSTPNSKTSRNIRKMRHKVRNGQNLPRESPNFTNNFFQSDFTYNLRHFSTSLRPHYHNSFFLNKCFVFYSKLPMSKHMCIWRHKLCNSKTGVGPTFTWSNEP